MNLRYVSIFSGIDCASVAFLPLGWKPLAFSEVDSFACAVLAHHYPAVSNLGDMTQVDWAEFKGRVDVVIGGPPCQAFSIVGARKSLGDRRGCLSLEYARVIHEIDPAFSITENVPAWLNTPDNAFGFCLAGLVGASRKLLPPDGTRRWPSAGLVAGPRRTAAWRILDAQHFGLAQRRKRVFVVSCRARDRLNPGAVLFDRKSLPGNPAPGGKAGEADPSSSSSGADGGGRTKLNRLDVSGAVSAKWSKGTGGPSGDECYNLVPVAFSCKDGGADAGPISPTLRAMPHHHSRMNGGGQVAVATMRVSPTLRADGGALRPEKDTDAVIISYRPELASKTDRVDSPRNMTSQVMSEWSVRRLTPREAERLMGLPDAYTLVPFGKGGRHKDLAEMARYWNVSEDEAAHLAADSHRYRAIGNGMAVPVIRWIGRRIEMVVRTLKRRRP